jgi:hypothetical protein
MSTSSWSLHGYDNLKQLLDMQPEEIIDVLKEVALYDKPGHRKLFISANTNTEYRIKTRQKPVYYTNVEGSSASHNVITSKYTYFNMFCMADIKNKDNFGKTVGPAHELKFFNNKLDGLKSMKVKLEESHTAIVTN